MIVKDFLIADVRVGDRVRPLDPEKVSSIADSIKSIGLNSPIGVSDSGDLIYGNHRIEAFKLLGRDTIPAFVYDEDGDTSKLREIDENLSRSDLTVLQVSQHVEERNKILGRMGKRARSGDNRHSRGPTVGPLETTTRDVADSLGVSKSTVQNYQRIARDIEPEVQNLLADTEIADSTTQLLDIAKMEPKEQKEVAQKIADGFADSVKDARMQMVPAPHVSNNSGNNEWYTPPKFIEAARAVMGSIDLDPASSDIANQTVNAANYYTAEVDGLTKDWVGNVWMNPPYSQPLIGQFCEKIASSDGISQACILVNNATETEWFSHLFGAASAVCFIRSRVKFLDQNGKESGAPLQGQAVVYIGDQIDDFYHNFSQFGYVLYVCLDEV